MGPVIKAQKFDEQNGLDLTFVQKPTATYRTDFAAGTDQLGGSGTLLADVALLKEKGLEPNFAHLRLAYLLGPADAARIMQAQEQTPVMRLLSPAVIKANPFMRSMSVTELLAKSPAKAVEKAVRGMLPHTTLGREQLTHLKVYAGAEHPHAAQKPQPFEISQVAQ